MPETSVQAILSSYQIFPSLNNERAHLKDLIGFFKISINEVASNQQVKILQSDTAIQGMIIPGNENVKAVALRLQSNNLDVRPILYPSVPKLSERLRIVLHSFNTKEEIAMLRNALA